MAQDSLSTLSRLETYQHVNGVKEGRTHLTFSSCFLLLTQVISRIRSLGNHWMGNALCKRRSTDKGVQFGSSTVSARAKARITFVTAVRRVIHLLRLRRKWAAYGRVLQLYPRKDLWKGLSRNHGQLTRLFPAPSGPEFATFRTLPASPKKRGLQSERT